LQTERLFQSAHEHLNKQGADADELPKSLASLSSSEAQNGSLDEAQRLIADLKRVVEEDILKTAKPESGWHPNSEGAGCGLAILGIVVGSIGVKLGGGFAGFVIGFCSAYFSIMWWLHEAPVSRLRSTFSGVHTDARRILGMLNEYATEMKAKAEYDLNSAEKRFNTEIAAIDKALREPIHLLHEDLGRIEVINQGWRAFAGVG